MQLLVRRAHEMGVETATRSSLRWLAFLIGLAFAARLAYLIIFGGLDNLLHDSLHDQNIYRDVARNLVSGRGFSVSIDMWIADAGKPTSIVAPIYPLVLASCFWLFGDNLVPIRLLQVLLSLAVVIPIYLLAGRYFGQRVARVAGLIMALYPALVMYVRPIMSETLFLALLTWTIYLTCTIDQSSLSPWRLALWGIVAGLAILTRSEALLLAPALLAFLAIRYYRRSGFKSMGMFVLPLATLALTLAPYAYHNYAVHGQFSPFPNKRWVLWEQIWLAEMRQDPQWRDVERPERKLVPDWDSQSEQARDAYLGNLGLQFAYAHPSIYLKQRIKQLYWAYPLLPTESILLLTGREQWGQSDGSQISPTSLDDRVQYTTIAEQIRVWAFRLIAMLAVAGLLRFIAHRRWDLFWLLLILLWSVGCSVLFAGKERYRIQVDPFLILLGAAYLDYLWVRLGLPTSRERAEQLVPVSANSRP